MSAVGIARRVGAAARERGPLAVTRACLGWGAGYLGGRFAGGGAFDYDGERLPYFRHPYRWTWLTERAVEIALARRVLAGRDPAGVLEVGNVLAHYLPTRHEVVDKYERTRGVRNDDVVDFSPGRTYDLVVSVSTLEHVGLDEDVRDPGKPVRALRRLVELLAPGGTLWVTVPVGYNADLDEQLRAGAVTFDRLSALRREPHRNRWRQVPVEQVWDAGYDRLLYTAHGLLVGELRRLP